jgi:hypothetical protein
MTRKDAADLIARFLNGTHRNPWEWDDFVSERKSDPIIESVRLRCALLWQEFPPPVKSQYCSDEGLEVLRQLEANLRRASD